VTGRADRVTRLFNALWRHAWWRHRGCGGRSLRPQWIHTRIGNNLFFLSGACISDMPCSV